MTAAKLTDRQAIRVALETAIASEEEMVKACGGKGEGAEIAQRNIEAFRRVLSRHYPKRSDPFAGAKRVSVFDIIHKH
jgi:hypothetical protein